MKYSIDKIEDNIVLLEEITTGEKIEILKSKLPCDIHEGSILTKDGNTYIIDLTLEEERRNSIKERFNRLKKK